MDEHEEPAGDDLKDCPYCGEAIKKAAIKCRHCGERLKGKRPKGGYDPARRRIEDAANLSMIMGILSLLLCPCLSPIAIIKGNEAKRLALQARSPAPGGATAGQVLGWIVIVGNVLVVGIYVLIIAVAVAGGAASGS